jgi:protein tyrosine/serine phosphatase
MTTIENAYWIKPQSLMAGPYPAARFTDEQNSETLDWLLSQGIRHIIDLSNVAERRPYDHLFANRCARNDMKGSWQRMPITDFGLPSRELMRCILDEIDRLMSTGGVYFHCVAGLGRTGTVAGCWLVRQGMFGEQALSHLQELRKNTPNGRFYSPETDAQRSFVRQWKSK